MARRWRLIPIVAAALAGPVAEPAGAAGDFTRRSHRESGTPGRREAHRGLFPIVRGASGVIAMPAHALPDRFYRGPIRPFGSVQTGLGAGIGYGYPAPYPTPDRLGMPRPRISW